MFKKKLDMSNFKIIIKKFPKVFWVANSMEMFERIAWYGLFTVLALYLTNSTDTGALGFSQTQKGTMMGIVTAILYLLPVITGAIADRVGYKKVLIVAYIIYSTGYLMMGYFTNYYSVFAAFLWVALGAALFKPVISATVAKSSDEESSSIAFGIFYMIVNIGGFVGPFIASKLRHANNGTGWRFVFYMSTIAILINLILVIFFYKEPEREKSDKKISEVINNSLNNIWTALKDVKLFIFLIIMVGFWTMFNQLFYTLPNFLDQWIDTSVLYNSIHNISPWLAETLGTKHHDIAPEMIINLDAGLIVLIQVLVSTIVMKLKPINAIITGILINAVGIGFAFATNNPFYIVLAILIFAIGEMASSPKFTEYVGRIAPKGKEALYMGTSFLPVAAGNFFTGFLSGNVYESLSDKTSLLQKEVATRNIQIPEISKEFTQNQFFEESAKQMSMTKVELTQYLWDTYHPSNIWYIFSAIGIATILGLFIYDKFVLKSNKSK